MKAKLPVRRVPFRAVDPSPLVALINDAYLRYPILTAPRFSLEGFLDEAKPDSEFLLADDGDRIAACAMVYPAGAFFRDPMGDVSAKPAWSEGSSQPSAPDESEMREHLFEGDLDDALYFGLAAVLRSVQGAGVGSALLAEAEAIARERGLRRVVLTTVAEFGLDRYYERFGFRVTGALPYPAGHWSIVVPHRYCFMEKLL